MLLSVQCQVEQPCQESNVFVSEFEPKYSNPGQNWYGKLTLISPINVRRYYLDLIFNQDVTLTTPGRLQVQSNNPSVYRLIERYDSLQANDVVRVTLNISYAGDRQEPLFREIRLNGVRQCLREIDGLRRNPNSIFNPIQPTTTQRSNVNNWPPQFSDNNGAGGSDVPRLGEIPGSRDVTTQTQTSRPSTSRVTERATVRTTTKATTTESPFYQGDLNILFGNVSNIFNIQFYLIFL